MDTILVCGGPIDDAFARAVLQRIRPDCIIGIDRGLGFCRRNDIYPDYILGDFDSIAPPVLEYFETQSKIPVKRYKPEKDASDTRIGLELALELDSDRIFLLGATGGRLDHYMANLQSLQVPLEKGAQAWILDEQNVITVLDKGMEISKDKMPGPYISFFSLGDKVEGLCLEGFKYPLEDYTMYNWDGIGVSNEIEMETARITFKSGRLLMIMSRDKDQGPDIRGVR